MSDRKYVRPDIDRAQLVNPARQAGEFTLEENEIQRIFDERVRQERTTFGVAHHQYDAPFNYDNFRVELGRPWENAANQSRPDAPEEDLGSRSDEYEPGYVGAEMNPDGVEIDVPPYGAITFVEDQPIVEVTVVGSACVPPGYVLLHGEPVEWTYARSGVKMRVDNLWGEHLRWHLWSKGIDESYRDAGLSCAIFRTPPCRKITIMAGSQHTIDALDVKNMRHDAHYAVRHIYVTMQTPA